MRLSLVQNKDYFPGKSVNLILSFENLSREEPARSVSAAFNSSLESVKINEEQRATSPIGEILGGYRVFKTFNLEFNTPGDKVLVFDLHYYDRNRHNKHILRFFLNVNVQDTKLEPGQGDKFASGSQIVVINCDNYYAQGYVGGSKYEISNSLL